MKRCVFEALENARPLNALTEADRRAAFEHLLQFRMLHSQMQGSTPATDAEVKARISEIRAGWRMANDDARWNSTLCRYGLSAEELHELVANQIEILRFLEYRVRPLVRVSRKEVEEYYKNTLVPELKSHGHGPEPIESVTSKFASCWPSKRKISRWKSGWRICGNRAGYSCCGTA